MKLAEIAESVVSFLLAWVAATALSVGLSCDGISKEAREAGGGGGAGGAHHRSPLPKAP